MTRPFLITLVLACGALGSACTTSSSPSSSAPDGSAPAPDAAACVAGRVWTATSRRIEMDVAGPPYTAMRYQKNRDELSPAQLAALDALCEIPPPAKRWSDVVVFATKIIDQDGSSKTFFTGLDNMGFGNQSVDPPTLDYTSLAPFLATLHCVDASATARSAPDGGASSDGVTPPWSESAIADDDPGCFDGFDDNGGDGDHWLRLRVSAAGRYTLATFDCCKIERVRLLSEDGSTELATSGAPSPASCPGLEYSFAQPGNHVVAIEQRATASYCEPANRGYAFFRITPAPSSDGGTSIDAGTD